MSAGGQNGDATCCDERAGGSATAVRPAVEAGEDSLIRETCWASSVRVTEKVTETVTQREKVSGVTETCTSETRRQVTELTGTREIEERLHGMDGVKDEHTHIELARDDEGERERVETQCGQLGSLPRERRETLFNDSMTRGRESNTDPTSRTHRNTLHPGKWV